MGRGQDGFERHDWAGDSAWQSYRLNVTVPPGKDEHQAMRRLQQKFYKRHIDPDYEIDNAPTPAPTPSTSQPPPSSSSSRQPPPPQTSSQRQPSAPPRASSQTGSQQQTFLFMANAWVVVMALVYVFPLTPRPIGYRAYNFALIGAMVTYFASLSASYPRPALNRASISQYLQTISITNDFQYLFFCFLFVNAPPVTLVMVPIVTGALFNTCTYLSRNFSQTPLWRNYGARLYAKLQQHTQDALLLCAACEVTVGFILLLQVFTGPSRNLMRVFAYWQLLRMRYRSPSSSANHRRVWYSLGMKVDPLLNRIPVIKRAVAYVQRMFQA
eukprot:jgi/Chlat1/7865/Chrsp66S07304